MALRGYLTTYVNFCWGIGQVLGIGVIKSMLGRTDALSWKIPYAIQWIWPVPLFIGVLFAPESPWWLVRHGKIDQAKRSIMRLTSKKDENFNVDETIAMMQHTTQIEEKVSSPCMSLKISPLTISYCRSPRAHLTGTASRVSIADARKSSAWFGPSRTSPATRSVDTARTTCNRVACRRRPRTALWVVPVAERQRQC